jgi:hypothetical protein
MDSSVVSGGMVNVTTRQPMALVCQPIWKMKFGLVLGYEPRILGWSSGGGFAAGYLHDSPCLLLFPPLRLSHLEPEKIAYSD